MDEYGEPLGFEGECGDVDDQQGVMTDRTEFVKFMTS